MSIRIQVCPGRTELAAKIITEVLSTQPDLQVTLCSACRKGPSSPDVVVMTTSLSADDGLAEIAATRLRHPDATLIVLSLWDDPAVASAILRYGADRFIPLVEAVPALMDAIRGLPQRPLVPSFELQPAAVG